MCSSAPGKQEDFKMWGGGEGLSGCDPGAQRHSDSQGHTSLSSPQPEPPDGRHSNVPDCWKHVVGRSFNICEWEEYHGEQCQLPQCEGSIGFSEEMECRVEEPLREFVDTFRPFPSTSNLSKITLGSYSGEVVLVAKWEEEEGRVVVRGSITLDNEEGEFMAFCLRLMDQVEEDVVLVEREEQLVKEQNVDRGEVTPPPTPRLERHGGSKSRSPRAKDRQLARLLLFQERLCEEYGLPPSQLQEKKKLEQEMTPSPSPSSSPEGRGSRGGGVDLREEFEKIGAEAQLLSHTTPVVIPGGDEQEVLPAGERECSHVTTMDSWKGDGTGAEALTSPDVNVDTLILFSIYIIS